MFSVIISCHNEGPFVGRALHSVAEQTFPPHEIILVDGGSTDDSLTKVRESGLDVRVLDCTRGAAAAVRNQGLKVASGTWIAFLKARDLWYRYHLEHAAELLQSHNDVALACTHDVIFEHKPAVVRRFPCKWPLKEPTPDLTQRDFLTCFRIQRRLCTAGVIVQRGRLLEVGGFDATQKRQHNMEMLLRVIAEHTWALNTVPTMARQYADLRRARDLPPGCEFYLLRAFLKNREKYRADDMQHVIHEQAREVVRTAFTCESEGDREEARKLAWRHLTAGDRRFFEFASRLPGSYRGARLMCRWLTGPKWMPKVPEDDR
jgi:glycosyltransferase involved in cell wall biosynthesis